MLILFFHFNKILVEDNILLSLGRIQDDCLGGGGSVGEILADTTDGSNSYAAR